MVDFHVATIAERAFPVVFGGDHYCTFTSFRGFAEGNGHETIGLVQVDAHTNTVRESAVFGEHFHGSSTNLIAESPHTDFENVSQVGIRGYESPDFFDFADEIGLNLFTARDVREHGIRDVVSNAVAAAEDTDSVYVTFDIEAVDPSVAPVPAHRVPRTPVRRISGAPDSASRRATRSADGRTDGLRSAWRRTAFGDR